MDYYTPPDGTERALKSRIRRCYDALDELKPAVKSLTTSSTHLNEDYAIEAATQMKDIYEGAVKRLTGFPDLDMFDGDLGIQRAQNKLLDSPGIADDICRSIEDLHDAANVVIRNLEYQLDAGHVAPTDTVYQTIREQAMMILALTGIVLDAIDSGFITDASIYNATGC